VLDGAMELFAERGFAATTIAEIERAAGLSPGAGGIYRHFASKVELLEAGVRDALAANEAMHRIVVDHSALPVRDHLTLYVRTGLVVIRNQRRLIRLLYRDLDAFPELLAEVKARLVHVGTLEFADRLRDLVKAHGLPGDPDVDALATLYVGSVVNVGVLEALLDEPSPVDDDRFVAAFVDTLHTYLTTGGPRP
jgi:AcrR family transcriptional regulator